jgi:HK97 family phage major capsid protein
VNKKVLWGSIRGIVDSNKRPIFDPESKTLCGYPVVEDDYVDATNKDLYLGRWTDIVGNLSQDVTVDKSEQSGFLRGAIDYRGFAVFDSKPAKTDGIVRLTTGA